MLDFLRANGATIVVGIAVAALLLGITVKMIRDKRNGKSSCGGGCAGCPNAGACHPK